MQTAPDYQTVEELCDEGSARRSLNLSLSQRQIKRKHFMRNELKLRAKLAAGPALPPVIYWLYWHFAQ